MARVECDGRLDLGEINTLYLMLDFSGIGRSIGREHRIEVVGKKIESGVVKVGPDSTSPSIQCLQIFCHTRVDTTIWDISICLFQQTIDATTSPGKLLLLPPDMSSCKVVSSLSSWGCL